MKEFIENFFQVIILGDVIKFLLIVSFSIIVGKIVYYIFKHPIKRFMLKTKSKADETLLDIIEEPFVFFILILGFYWGGEFLKLNPDYQKIYIDALKVLTVFNVTYLLVKLFDFTLISFIKPYTKKTKSKLDDQLIPLVSKIFKVIVWVIAIIVVLDNFGVDVASLIAGLGIGGLALSIAAKDTLSNIFGSINLFADRPFQINDIVKIGEYVGEIKEVGLRSTKIRTFDSTEIIIPNSNLANLVIENYSRRGAIKKDINFDFYYDISNKKLEKAISIIKSVLKKNKGSFDEFYVGFNEFGEDALKVRVVYWIKFDGDFGKYLDAKTKINLEIKKGLEKAKIKLEHNE